MDGDDLRAAPTPQFRAPGHTSGAAAASRIGPSSTPLSSSAGRGLVTEEGVTLKREGHWLHLPVLRLAGVCLVSSSEGSLGLSLRGCLWDPVLEFTKAFQSSEPGLGTGTLCDALYPARWHLFLQCDSWVQDTFRSVSAYALPLSLPVSVECPLPVSLSVRLTLPSGCIPQLRSQLRSVSYVTHVILEEHVCAAPVESPGTPHPRFPTSTSRSSSLALCQRL